MTYQRTTPFQIRQATHGQLIELLAKRESELEDVQRSYQNCQAMRHASLTTIDQLRHELSVNREAGLGSYYREQFEDEQKRHASTKLDLRDANASNIDLRDRIQRLESRMATCTTEAAPMKSCAEAEPYPIGLHELERRLKIVERWTEQFEAYQYIRPITYFVPES